MYVRITFIRKNSVAYVKNNVICFRKFALPFTHSYRIEFYFLRCRFYEACRSAHLDARETRPPAHWASQAIRLYGANSNGVYGTALGNCCTNTVFRKRLRKRMNRNVRLETRH